MLNAEIVIVGGGLSGLVTAKYLSKLGISYLLLDKYEITKLADNDLRTTAVNYMVAQNLQYLGIWDSIEESASPIKNILIKNNINESELYFAHDVLEISPMGYILPNSLLKNSLIDSLDKTQLLDKQEVTDIKTTTNDITITTDKNLTIKAKLVIISDGKFSKLKDFFNIESVGYDYQQTSHIFNTHHVKPHNNLALEQFLSKGPVAFLPLKDQHQSSIVYTKTTDFDVSDINKIEQELNIIGSDTYGEVKIISEIKSFPLSIHHCHNYYRNRLVFIGDSLHTMHPIAGQGFNLTMRDIEQITHLVFKYKNLGMDIGSKILLKSFEKSRKTDNLLMLGSTHGLVKLFSNDNSFINSARNLGLKLFGKSYHSKKSAIAYAMGLK